MMRTAHHGAEAARVACGVLRDRLLAQEPAAWREVMTDHGPPLVGYARKMLRDAELAEDVVQVSLLSAFRNLEGFDCRAGLKAWLYRIVHNRCIDELRKRRLYLDVDVDDPDAALFGVDGHWISGCPTWGGDLGRRVEARDLLGAVALEIEALPHSYRDVLMLKEVHGLDTDEVCEALGISPGNLRIRLHRARKALRAAVVARGVV